MTFWINVVSATISYGPEITFPMKFRPGTTKICAQNTWDNLRGKQMLLATCALNVLSVDVPGELCCISRYLINLLIYHFLTFSEMRGWVCRVSRLEQRLWLFRLYSSALLVLQKNVCKLWIIESWVCNQNYRLCNDNEIQLFPLQLETVNLKWLKPEATQT